MLIWLAIGVVVIAALAYVAWEFRWYWSSLVNAWRNDEEPVEREPDHELAGRHKTV